MITDAPLLELRGVSKHFTVRKGWRRERLDVLHDINFRIDHAESVALVGESGSGKSTVARIVARLVQPDEGELLVEGRNVLREEPGRPSLAYRRAVQMIFQDPFASLNPRMTVGDAIAEPIIVHELAKGQEARARVASLLQRVGLEPEHAARYPHEFSGGQRQRLCIARALGLEPQLIIADEAVSALDVSIQAQVINLMMDLQEEFGLSYLFISHDMAVVERVSHRVAVVYLGEIVELGMRGQVFENPQHPYTKKLMSAVPVADPNLRKKELNLMTDEIPSPLKPIGFEPEDYELVSVDAGHYVKPFDGMAA